MSPRISHTRTESIIIWTVGILFFMESLDASALNTSLPSIALSLGVNPIHLKIALTSYLLSLGVFVPISGWMADHFGVRRMLCMAVGLFVAGSIGCGCSNSLNTLVICRILQGAGGSFTTPIGRLVMLRNFQKARLLPAMMRVTTLGLMGPSLGPVLGGALTTYLSWRWIFFINIPVGIAAIWLIQTFFPKTGLPVDKRFDLMGFVYFGVSLGLLLYTLDVAADPILSVWHKCLLGCASGGFFIAYIFHSRHTQDPMLDMNVFRNSTFRNTFIASNLSRLGMSAMPFLIPLLMQLGFGFTPMESGATMIFLVSGNIINKFFLPKLIDRWGYHVILPWNTLTIILSYLVLSLLIIPHFNWWIFAAWGACNGFLTATQYASMTTLMFYDLEDQDRSMANSFFSTSTQVDSCFGIAFAALGLEFLIGQTNLTHSIAPHYFGIVTAILIVFLIPSFWILYRTTQAHRIKNLRPSSKIGA